MFNEQDQDLYAVIFTGPLILIAFIGGAGTWIWARGTEATAWLIEHHILVPSDQALIPILDAGLDPARCVLLGAVAFLLLWATIASVRRNRRRRAWA